MTFGEIKTIIEESLIESYNDSKNFKSVMTQFNRNVLSNKNISKLFYIYDDLTTKKGLTESEAKEYLEEGIQLIRNVIEESKLPKFTSKKIDNRYKDLDVLVYSTNINISERLNSRKKLIYNLSEKPAETNKKIEIPLTSMVSVANQTLNKYVDNLDEESKKNFLYVIREDQTKLKSEFDSLKENTIKKLQNLVSEQDGVEIKDKINETIQKLQKEEFNQMNFVRLKSFEKSI